MTDRPIPMSGPMVRATLEGRKSQTRRVITKLRRFGEVSEFGRSDTPGYEWHFRDRGMRWHDLRHDELLEALPYAAGDRLYVREHWRAEARYDDFAPRELKAGVPVYPVADPDPRVSEPGCAGRFRQGMHMPRWASRITLIVKDVRVERLQDISEEDAIAEGVYFDGALWTADGINYGNSPIDAFQCLWLSIHGDDAWSDNPWIVAISFDPILANIDSLSPEIDVNKMREAR